MPGVVTLGNHIKLITIDDEAIKIISSANLPEGTRILSSAVGSENVLFYLPSDSPADIYEYSLKEKTTRKLLSLSKVSKKILFVKDKLYVLAADGFDFFVVDILAVVVETICIPCGPVDSFQNADHGFVFYSSLNKELVSFHFNDGFRVIIDDKLGSSLQLLGTLKRQAVAQGRNQQLGITESGEVVPWSGFCCPNLSADQTFITVDDVIVVVHAQTRAIKIAGGNALVRIPGDALETDVLTVSAVPPSNGDEEKLCPLCFCEMDEGGMTLDCGHSFHVDCVEMWVKSWEAYKPKAEHIVFTNAYCPSGCKHLIRHILIPASESISRLYSSVMKSCNSLIEAHYPDKTADDLLHYICSQCQEPFFGGEKVCFRMLSAEPTKQPSELLCDTCQSFLCPQHGSAFPLYKCRYCCNPATQRSFGTRFLCNRCNQRWEKTEIEVLPCSPNTCPFGGAHSAYTSGEPPRPEGCLACYIAEHKIDFSKIAEEAKATLVE